MRRQQLHPFATAMERCTSRHLEVDQNHRDVIDNRAALLSYPTVPRLLCEFLGCRHCLSARELGDYVDGLFRADELPNTITAQEYHAVISGQIAHSHFGLARDATVR